MRGTINSIATSLLGLLALSVGIVGCNHVHSAAPESQAKAPEVEVSKPISREVTDYRDFTGRTEAINQVEVRARVTGYLTSIPFKEGAEVKKGDVLFEIDARPYQAQLARDQGTLKQAEANVIKARNDYARAKRLAETPGAITAQDIDMYAAALSVAEAQVISGKAAVDASQLNVEFCTVRAPIDGRISRFLVTVGNLVVADQTMLTTIVSVDPMYVYFDVDEGTMLHVRDLIRQGKLKSVTQGAIIPAHMGLANEEGYPHAGTVNFVDNRVNQATGTLQVRAVFSNPMVNDYRLLSPGLFARVRVATSVPYQALLVSDRATGVDQEQHFAYVVNDQNTVEYRKLKLGDYHGRLRVVQEGLKPNDNVVVSGLQRVRPGMKVTPKVVEMPGAKDEGEGTKEEEGRRQAAGP